MRTATRLDETKKNFSVHGKKVEITQQIQKEARMNKSEEDGNGFAIVVFENLKTFVVCNV